MFSSRFISFAVAAAMLIGQAQAAPLLATDPGTTDSKLRRGDAEYFYITVSACGPSINANPNLGASCQFSSNGSPIVSGSESDQYTLMWHDSSYLSP